MSTTDWILDLSLLALVLLQVHGRRITRRALLLPVGIVAWAAMNYLHGIPTAGNDLALVALTTGTGVALGIGAALFTRVEARAQGIYAKAGVTAAVLWVAGVGTRLAFQLYSSHGGEAAIVRFSAQHGITSGEAWVAALVLMALGEVLARTAVIAYRAYRLNPAVLQRPLPSRTDNMVRGDHGVL